MNLSLFPKTHKDDRGLSLIELVVVITIMAVMIGLLSLGISMLFSRDAERVAKQIDDSLSETRLSSMSKQGKFVIKINTKENGNGNSIDVIKTGIELPDLTNPGSNVSTPSSSDHLDMDKTVYITFGQKGALPADASDDTLEIEFDKADGHITKLQSGAGSYSFDSIFEIKCETRNKTKSKSILIMPVTGRHYIE